MQNLLPTAAALAEYMWLTGEYDSDRITRFREVLDEGIRLENLWAGGDLAFWLWKLGELSGTPEGIAEPYRLVIEGKPTEAAAIWEAKEIPYERALALMHGDQKAQLEALQVLETLGAIAVAAKLRQSLRDQGVSVPRGKRRDTRRHRAVSPPARPKSSNFSTRVSPTSKSPTGSSCRLEPSKITFQLCSLSLNPRHEKKPSPEPATRVFFQPAPRGHVLRALYQPVRS